MRPLERSTRPPYEPPWPSASGASYQSRAAASARAAKRRAGPGPQAQAGRLFPCSGGDDVDHALRVGHVGVVGIGLRRQREDGDGNVERLQLRRGIDVDARRAAHDDAPARRGERGRRLGARDRVEDAAVALREPDHGAVGGRVEIGAVESESSHDPVDLCEARNGPDLGTGRETRAERRRVLRWYEDGALEAVRPRPGVRGSDRR